MTQTQSTARRSDDRAPSLEEKIDALSADVAFLVERQRVLDDLIEDGLPIVKAMASTATERLDVLDKKGYFRFGTELLGVADAVVTGFSPDDVRALGENVVRILQTVRDLTQPEVLAVIDEVADSVEEGGHKPVGVMGALRATRDDDVKQGLAVAVNVLRHLGRASKHLPRSSGGTSGERDEAKAKLQAMLAPRQRPAAKPRMTPAPVAAPAPATPASATPAPAAAAPTPAATHGTQIFGGVAWTADGFLVDVDSWSRDLAVAVAQAQQIALTDAHWHVLEYIREAYKTGGSSPNVRAVSVGANVSTRELYQLFPPAPGKVAARIAGVPKPTGCL
jgi:TusE/DsrC/DsvC family sulfur relay protein